MFVRRILVLALCVGAFGCAREEGARPGGGETATAAGSPGAQALAVEGTAGAAAMAGSTGTQLTRHVQGFASLPDRGELLAYRKDTVRARGAYTWYRADVSEAHALAAIASGHLRVPTPDGKLLDFKYDRHVEHASGDWTWIGHLAGNKAVQTVLTFGAEAAFGSIGQPDQRPLRMIVRDGQSWMVATDAAKLAKVIGRYTADPDYLIVPAPRVASGDSHGRVKASALAPRVQEANAAGTVVDVLVGYSPGFVTAQGGQSAALTRINYLVDYTNQAYANSDDSTSRLGRIRLVGTMQVNYADNTDNTDTLHKLSGYDSNTGRTITPDPAFNALRAARETYGADLVSFVHDFRTPENDSCGVAWLIGGGKQGIAPSDGWDYLGYSVVSDGSDVDEGDSGNYYCEDHTFAHELGHNMGLAHDRETSAGGDGVLNDPGDYGVSSYSFGYKTSSGFARLYTVMAYGDAGQKSFNIFSNPRKTTFCGGYPCGVAKGQPQAADAALSLSETMPLIAAFRASVSSGGGDPALDLNADGRSDIFWSNRTGQMADWWLMNGTSWTYGDGKSVASRYWVAGRGDFDGDGRGDILWEDGQQLWIWHGEATGGFTIQWLAAHPQNGWAIAGVGDLNGDGRDDIFWSNRTAGAADWWLMNGTSWTYGASKAVGSQYRVAGIGDFDGDGRDDVLWQDDASLWIWHREATDAFTVQFLGAHPQNGWSIAATGDLDGDGRDDIFWSNRTAGAADWWLMNGTTWTYGGGKSVVSQYHVVGLGDFDGDGRADVLWADPNELWIWHREAGNGFAIQPLSNLPAGWTPIL